jgi:hypothetical protein
MAEQKTTAEIIIGHEDRNARLLCVLLEKRVDLAEPRTIECHFWTWSEKDAAALGESLARRGLTVRTQRPAQIPDDPSRWNLEITLTQSIDVTTSREFTTEIAELAASHGVYDGWGTSI